MGKIAVYHFNNGSGGGVLSVIKNLFRFSGHPSIENHIIYTINKDNIETYTPFPLQGAVSETVFFYSPRANFYATCKALAKLVPNQQAVLVTHDWLELGMISHMGLQNPVVTFLHGDYEYYYQLAGIHQHAVDKYFAVAESIASKLKNILAFRSKDVYYLRFPVPAAQAHKVKKTKNSIAFIGRLSAAKGYPILPAIDEILRRRGLCFTWHIAGNFITSNDKEAVQWSNGSSTVLYGEINNQEIMQLLGKMEYFVLPSSSEGMPVTLIEAMKSGVIPIVNDIEGGIQELVENEVTGYKIKQNNPAEYADRIAQLADKEALKAAIKRHAIEKSNALFDPYENTRLIEEQICTLYDGVRHNKTPKAIYGSRLDKSWIPNFITKTVRTLR